MKRMSKGFAAATVVMGMMMPTAFASTASTHHTHPQTTTAQRFASTSKTPKSHLAKGEHPVLHASKLRVKAGSIVRFTVSVVDKNGKKVVFSNKKGPKSNLPASATLTYHLFNNDGAVLVPSTNSLMITKPGTFRVRITVDGIASAPVTIHATDVPAQVNVSAAKSILIANGKAKDPVTVTVLDAQGLVDKSFNGSINLTPLAHGQYVNPKTGNVMSVVKLTRGVGKLDVEAGTTGGVLDTISVTDLTSSGQPVAGVNYESTSVEYTWSEAQPAGVNLDATKTVLVANGSATSMVTATVVNGYGTKISSFNGYATLSPLAHGTYVDPTDKRPITTVKFTRGVAKFAVQSGTTGGTSDYVSLSDLSAANHIPEPGVINYSSLNIQYAWDTNEPTTIRLVSNKSLLVADGKSAATITATVENGDGTTVTSFNGSATLAPILNGTYEAPSTGAPISTVNFSRGVATFDVVAGTTGGTSDTVMLTNLTLSNGQTVGTVTNYGTTTIQYTWNQDQPAGVKLTSPSTVLSANGTATDPITATVVDGYGRPVTSFSGTAVLTPLSHGTYVDPSTGAVLTSITFKGGVAHFDVKAGTEGGVTDAVSLSGLTSSTGVPESGISYGLLTLDYLAAAGQPVAVNLTEASPSIAANGTQTDLITATVADAYGQTAAGFNGSATLTPLKYGTYVDPSTGQTLSSVAFVNGIATFAVKSGLTGGVSDTIGLSDLTSGNTPMDPNFQYGTATVSYTWPTANGISLTPANQSVSDNQPTQDLITATLPSSSATSALFGTTVSATFSLSGPGSFAESGTPVTSINELLIPGEPTVVPVWSIPSQSGTITVAATAKGLSTSSVSVQAISTGAPAGLTINGTQSTLSGLGLSQEPELPAGTPFTLYTVKVVDANGNPVAPSASDILSITDNTSTVGGTISYYAVANGQPTGPQLGPNPIALPISSGTVQFAAVNTVVGGSNPIIHVSDSSGLSAEAPYDYSAGSASYALFSGDSTANLTGAQSLMEVGQTATYTVQVVDGNGNPITTAGQTIDVYFDAGRNGNSNGSTIDGSSTWSASSPYVVETNPQGQAVVTVTAPSAGQFTLVAALPGGAGPAKNTVSVVGTAAYTTQLILSNSEGMTTPLAWPTSAMTVGETLSQFLSPTASVSGPVYVTPLNSQGDAVNNTAEALQITTSNPDVLSILSDGNWTAQGNSNAMFTGVAGNSLPTIVAKQPGVATLIITDLSNPTEPRIVETVQVQ